MLPCSWGLGYFATLAFFGGSPYHWRCAWWGDLSFYGERGGPKSTRLSGARGGKQGEVLQTPALQDRDATACVCRIGFAGLVSRPRALSGVGRSLKLFMSQVNIRVNENGGIRMIRFSHVLFTAMCFLICISHFNLSVAQDKPLLSEAIRKMIDANGVEAAKKQFAEQYEKEKDRYNIDMEGIEALSNRYIQAGNYEAAGAVMEIVTPFMMAMAYRQSNDMIQQLKERQEEEEAKRAKEVEENERTQEAEVVFDQGEARDDLERFTGLYGDPEESNENRRLWVMVSCDGYLVVGALWGDVAPWWMKSASDKAFSYSDTFTNVEMEFETDGSGKALRMIHNLSFLKTPLERLGPAPEDWGSCLERPKR